MDTLFGQEDDGHATVRLEVRLKWDVGPFDAAGYSIDLRVGGKQVALEVVGMPGSTDLLDALHVLRVDLPIILSDYLQPHAKRSTLDRLRSSRPGS